MGILLLQFIKMLHHCLVNNLVKFITVFIIFHEQ